MTERKTLQPTGPAIGDAGHRFDTFPRTPKEGFIKLYGYTSDAGGIRHAIMDEPKLTAVGLCWAAWGFLYRPLPLLEENPLLDLVAFHIPWFYGGIGLSRSAVRGGPMRMAHATPSGGRFLPKNPCGKALDPLETSGGSVAHRQRLNSFWELYTLLRNKLPNSVCSQDPQDLLAIRLDLYGSTPTLLVLR